MAINLEDARPGDILHFRCGGQIALRSIRDTENDAYPYKIRVEGYHAAGCHAWTYSNAGQHGEGTGPGEKFPFDIVKITVKPGRKP